MPEAAEVKPVWQGKGMDEVRQFIVTKSEEANNFHKGIQGKADIVERIPYLETMYKEIEDATGYYKSLEKADNISRKLNEQMKAMKEPSPDHVPFASDGDKTFTQTPGKPALKSLEQVIHENTALKSVARWENVRQPFSFDLPDYMVNFSNLPVKTVMTRAAGYAPANDRTSKLVPYAQREPRLADLIPVQQTTLGTINYMEETTALAGTNAQVSIAEGNAKFENALAFTARTAPVETVGTWLPVTTQQLDDVPNIQGIIEDRMRLFLQLKEEDLLLNGTGTTPQLIGFQGAAASSVLTQATGTDTNIDAIFKAIQQIRVTGMAEPDGVVMHPNNFTPIALYKATTGQYGFDVTVDNGGVIRLWGKPLILSPVATAGTALVGDFGEYSEIWRRMGMTVMVGLNSDDFTKNKRTVLGEFREALTIYRQTAFCKVTGLA